MLHTLSAVLTCTDMHLTVTVCVCAPYLAFEVVSLMSVTLFRYTFLSTPLPYSDWSSFYQFVLFFLLPVFGWSKLY